MGIKLDVDALQQKLGVSVALVSAKRMEGWPRLMDMLNRQASALSQQCMPNWIRYRKPRPLHWRMLACRGMELASGAAQGMTEKVDAWLMHPWLGLPLFFGFMALLFNLTYQIGTPLQDLVAPRWTGSKRRRLGTGWSHCRPLCKACCWMVSGKGYPPF
jgi:ferrous iron transport protein B